MAECRTQWQTAIGMREFKSLDKRETKPVTPFGFTQFGGVSTKLTRSRSAVVTTVPVQSGKVATRKPRQSRKTECIIADRSKRIPTKIMPDVNRSEIQATDYETDISYSPVCHKPNNENASTRRAMPSTEAVCSAFSIKASLLPSPLITAKIN